MGLYISFRKKLKRVCLGLAGGGRQKCIRKCIIMHGTHKTAVVLAEWVPREAMAHVFSRSGRLPSGKCGLLKPHRAIAPLPGVQQMGRDGGGKA